MSYIYIYIYIYRDWNVCLQLGMDFNGRVYVANSGGTPRVDLVRQTFGGSTPRLLLVRFVVTLANNNNPRTKVVYIMSIPPRP